MLRTVGIGAALDLGHQVNQVSRTRLQLPNGVSRQHVQHLG